MEPAFNADGLQRRIEALSPRARLLFLLSCAERLFPNYSAFARQQRWGDPSRLQEALDLGWRKFAAHDLGRQEIDACLAGCEKVTPKPEDFDSVLVSPALDAAVCCAIVLEVLLDDDAEKVVEAASLARDTVDMYVQELDSLHPQDPDLEEKVLAHPLMQAELERQREDLEVLGDLERASSEAVHELSGRLRNPRLSNIGQPRIE